MFGFGHGIGTLYAARWDDPPCDQQDRLTLGAGVIFSDDALSSDSPQEQPASFLAQCLSSAREALKMVSPLPEHNRPGA